MKQIILKTLLYLGSMFLIVGTLNSIVPSKSQIEKNRIDSLVVNLDSYESITLGRSHAASLDYEFWDKKGINLALGGRDFASTRYLLDYFVPKMQNLREVILIISYSSFYYDNTALARGNLNDARKALYYSVPSIDIIDKSDISNYIFGKYFPFIQANHGYSFIKKLITSDSASGSLLENNWADGFMDSLSIIRSARKQAQVHSFMRYGAENYEPNVIANNKKNLIEIISLLQSFDISVIFVVPTYYKAYTEYFPKKDITEMKGILNYLSSKYNIRYFDFSNDSVLANNYKYYHNADHLNDKGKEIFTQKLLSRINDTKRP